jgi:hypothetical protein
MGRGGAVLNGPWRSRAKWAVALEERGAGERGQPVYQAVLECRVTGFLMTCPIRSAAAARPSPSVEPMMKIRDTG